MKMTLSVSSEDVSGEGGERSTEIYLPIIHYASDDFLEGAFLPHQTAQSRSKGGPERTDPLQSEQNMAHQSSPSPHINQEAESSNTGSMSSSPSISGSHSPATTQAPSLPAGHHPIHTPNSTELYPVAPEDYSLEVTLSTGRYEIHGQYLHWFYYLPSPSAPPSEYTITIRRSGGPITPALVKRLASSSARIVDGTVSVRTTDGVGSFEALYGWVAGLARGCVVM